MANTNIITPLISSINGVIKNKIHLKILKYTDLFDFTTTTDIPSGCILSPATRAFIIGADPIAANNRNCLKFAYTGDSIMDGSAIFTVSNSIQQSFFMDLYCYIWENNNGFMQISVDDVIFIQIDSRWEGYSSYINVEPSWNLIDDDTYRSWCRYTIPNLAAGTHTIKIRFFTSWTGSSSDIVAISKIGKVNEILDFQDLVELRPQKTITRLNSISTKAVTSLLVKQDLTGVGVPKLSAYLRYGSLSKYMTSNIKPSTPTINLSINDPTGARQVINAIQPATTEQVLKVNAFKPNVTGSAIVSITGKTYPFQPVVFSPRLIRNYRFYVYAIEDITASSCHVVVALDRVGEYEIEEFGIVYTAEDKLKINNYTHSIPLYDTITGLYSADLTQLQSDKSYWISTYIRIKGETHLYFNESDKIRINTPMRDGISLCLSDITNESLKFNIEDMPIGLLAPVDFPLRVYIQIKNYLGNEIFFSRYPNTMYTSTLFKDSIEVALPPNTISDVENSFYCDLRSGYDDHAIWKFYTTFVVPPNKINDNAPILKMTHCWNGHIQLSWNVINEVAFYRVSAVTNNGADIKTYDVPATQTTIELNNVIGYSKFNVRGCNSRYTTEASNFIEYTPKAFYPTPVSRVKYDNTTGNYNLYWTNNGANEYEVVCELVDGRFVREVVKEPLSYTIPTSILVTLKSVTVRGYEVDTDGGMTGKYSEFAQPIYV